MLPLFLSEHIVSMGTKKYPIESDFEDFVWRNGGYSKADTHDNSTVYYFSIGAKHLDVMLDRFSDLFKEPLMHKETVQRERESVDSEFSYRKFDEQLRHLNFILSSLGSPTHPSSLFSCGNLISLKQNISDDALCKKICDFQKRHYSANRMNLCLQASMSLDEMETLVAKHFSSVPKNDCDPGADLD